MKKNDSDFREIWTHEGAHGLIKEIVEKHGGKVLSHVYESTDPHGVVKVRKGTAFQSIRYGLPDDRDQLKHMAIAALEPPEQWKSQHRRDW
ncbi:MAG: hypothetical protein ACYTBJ_01125 [Planctomycetota bacterium]